MKRRYPIKLWVYDVGSINKSSIWNKVTYAEGDFTNLLFRYRDARSRFVDFKVNVDTVHQYRF